MTDLLDPPTEVLPRVADQTIDLTAYLLQPAVPATYIAARPDAYIGRHRPTRDPWTPLIALGLLLIAFAIAGFVMLRYASDPTGPAPAPASTTVPAPIPAPLRTGGAR